MDQTVNSKNDNLLISLNFVRVTALKKAWRHASSDKRRKRTREWFLAAANPKQTTRVSGHYVSYKKRCCISSQCLIQAKRALLKLIYPYKTFWIPCCFLAVGPALGIQLIRLFIVFTAFGWLHAILPSVAFIFRWDLSSKKQAVVEFR